ncbi:MAG: pyridoxamine 5'-phosphate oxidase [Spirochaetes bacterium]|nr:pyridoxamine 5'-phosphate oxidase [Spirochaetota bacterium]
MNLSDVRREYEGEDISALPLDPAKALERWLNDALKTESEPTAFSLATADAQGRVSARVVLAKGLDAHGITFYTSAASQKGLQIMQHPVAAGVFFWPSIHRQVRFEGNVSQLGAEEADTYFASRPRDSQIAAMISRQSQPIEGYQNLLDRFHDAQKKFSDKKIERPETWCGYLISLEYLEFWQGQANRLHQRLSYTRTGATYRRAWLDP